MSGKSDYLEAKVLDHILGGPAYTAPATVYFALFLTVPEDDGTVTEVSGTNYARVAITNNDTNFPAATGTNPTRKRTGVAVEWDTAGSYWGVVQAWGIYDDPTAGNLLYWGYVTPQYEVLSGDKPRFNVAQIIIYES